MTGVEESMARLKTMKEKYKGVFYRAQTAHEKALSPETMDFLCTVARSYLEFQDEVICIEKNLLNSLPDKGGAEPDHAIALKASIFVSTANIISVSTYMTAALDRMLHR